MSVQREPDGRRSIQVEVEVPGTPEQVWQAIASGPGVSAWFVPCRIEPGVGGKVTCTFGPGMDSTAEITAWDPPRKFEATSPGFAPGMPPMATQWTVEARGGGTCIVRVVHSLFASTDDWDDQLEGTEGGWPTFFAVLRLYLQHHAGQPSASINLMAPAPGTATEAWRTLTAALGVADARAGQRIRTRGDAPALGGEVTLKHEPEDGHGLIVHLDEPTPGVAVLGAHACGGGPVLAMVSLYLYGPRAAATVQEDNDRWQAWLASQFAMQA